MLHWCRTGILIALAVAWIGHGGMPFINHKVKAGEKAAQAKHDPPKAHEVKVLKSGHNLYLAPSPDGKKLALIQDINETRDGKRGPWWHLILVDTATGKSRELDHIWGMPPKGQAGGAQHVRIKLVWRPDGTRFLFANAMDGNWKVQVYARDGKKMTAFRVKELQGAPDRLRACALPSPDGQVIAFFAMKTHLMRCSRIALSDWNGKPRGILSIPGATMSSVTWKPDSRSLRAVAHRQVNGQWKRDGVFTISCKSKKAKATKGTTLADGVEVTVLSSDARKAILRTFVAPLQAHYEMIDLENGKTTEVRGPCRRIPGSNGFLLTGLPDTSFHYMNPKGLVTKLVDGPGLQKIPFSFDGHVGRGASGGGHIAFPKDTDLYAAELGVPGSKRLLLKNWLTARVHNRGRSVSYWNRTPNDKVVFSGDGKRLFVALNAPRADGTSILEIPLHLPIPGLPVQQ
jgi:hypothetical protein